MLYLSSKTLFASRLFQIRKTGNHGSGDMAPNRILKVARANEKTGNLVSHVAAWWVAIQEPMVYP